MSKAIMVEICDGPMAGACFQLLTDAVVIGRSPDCDVMVEHDSLSRRHAKLTVLPEGVRLQDQNSQNGMFVNEKRVTDVLIAPGQAFRLGQITLKVLEQHPVAAKGAGAVSARSSSAPARAGTAPVAGRGGIDGQLIWPEDAGGAKKSGLAWAVLLVVLFAAGMYAFSTLGANRSIDATFQIVRARQERVMMFRGAFHSVRPVGTDAGRPVLEVEKYAGSLSPSLDLMRTGNRFPAREFLLVRGAVEGNGAIELLDSAGAVVERYRVLVRGTLPRLWPEDIDPNSASALAAQFEREATVLEKDGYRYAAAAKLKDAEELFSKSMMNMDASQDVRLRRKKLETQLAKELRALFEEAMARAYPDAASKKPSDVRGAFVMLNEAKLLVPDDDCPEWQVLDLWQAEFRRILR